MSTSKPSAATTPARLYGKVLLVEDNPINQLVASEMLQLLGIEVDCANDGAEALEAHAGTRYDAILMDIQMPRVDGHEAAREIRRREAEQGVPRTPIIALTANASDADRAACLASGMDDFIGKPVHTEQLAAILRRYLTSNGG